LGIASLLFLFLVLVSLVLVQAVDCCPPPTAPPSAARFQRGSDVTVYLDTRGLTTTEVAAIKSGLEDWNDENNTSGVKYHVIETQAPPAEGENNTIVARFVDSPGSTEAAINMMDQRKGNGEVAKVWGTLTFWNRIRSGTPSLLPGFLRATARHEGGHGIGLANSDTNGCLEGSNIMYPSRNEETFITKCDNEKINEDPVYAPTPTPTPTATPTPEPTPCAGEFSLCAYPQDCCPGLTCGEITFRCIPCEIDSNHPQNGCMTESCVNCYNGEGTYCDPSSSSCWTPIIIDVEGDGFDFTDVNDGIRFDGFGHGVMIKTAWTQANSDDAWLVLDRNANGFIDDGTELFSSAAPQPELPAPQIRHGFNALVQYDKSENGGNGDGVLNNQDSIFNSLKVWQDKNHNGISEASELFALTQLGLSSIDMDYRLSRRKDRHGNVFKFRARVTDTRGAQLGRWAYDVFPVARP
jgi:hypothetical protein